VTRRPTTASILIVDDNPVAAAALAESLDPDLEIVIVHDGYEAIRQVCSGRAPDLVLLDVEMPGMDGYETCRELQSRRPTEAVPILFVTSEDDPAAEARALELGAVDYIVKPVNPVTVRARVRAHLRLHRRTSMLHDLIGRDPLTELPNRRRFDEALREECRRCERVGAPLSVVFIDVDYFKRFNDTFGHGSGDDCLRRVATALRESLSRAGDLVARYGGEEFVALLPETDRDGAGAVARRFRAAVEALDIPNPSSAVEAHVTISVGAVTATADGLPTDGQELLKAADRVLYLAKEAGRNRIAQGDFAVDRASDVTCDEWEDTGVHRVALPARNSRHVVGR
jgi:diguanylate cyclase (GGDEF)-like protein